MMAVIVLLVGEILLGVALGFFISDNRPGLSLEEVKVSSIVFLVTTGIVMLIHPDIDAIVFAHLTLGWLVINTAMLGGELIRLKLFQHLKNTIAKKDVQLQVNDFVRLATRYGFTCQEQDRKAVEAKLAEVQAQIRKVSARAARLEDKQIANRISVVAELCERYYDTALILAEEEPGERRDELLEQWNELGDALTDISWDTLNHAEASINLRLAAVWGRS